MSTDFDIAVVGAGPAGSVTALQLARQGCRVLLVDQSLFDMPRSGESLAPGVQPLLRELGLWELFLALSPLPSYGTRSVWGSDQLREHSHLVSPYQCGWHVDRLLFDRMLVRAAVHSGAEFHAGTSLVRCELSGSGSWQMELSTKGSSGLGQFNARFLIDATGRSAQIARRLGVHRMTFDHLVGVGMLFEGVDIAREGYILIESVPDGWWYSAPVSPDRLIVMLMTDADLYGRFGVSSSAGWRDLVRQAPTTRERVTGSEQWGPKVFSAISQRLRRMEHQAPCLAVGDAALAVDPVSGSGVVRALHSAQSCAETTLALLESGSPSLTEAYEAARDGECTSYLQERALYYGLEQRWQGSPFWQRRASAVEYAAHTAV